MPKQEDSGRTLAELLGIGATVTGAGAASVAGVKTAKTAKAGREFLERGRSILSKEGTKTTITDPNKPILTPKTGGGQKERYPQVKRYSYSEALKEAEQKAAGIKTPDNQNISSGSQKTFEQDVKTTKYGERTEAQHNKLIADLKAEKTNPSTKPARKGQITKQLKTLEAIKPTVTVTKGMEVASGSAPAPKSSTTLDQLVKKQTNTQLEMNLKPKSNLPKPSPRQGIRAEKVDVTKGARQNLPVATQKQPKIYRAGVRSEFQNRQAAEAAIKQAESRLPKDGKPKPGKPTTESVAAARERMPASPQRASILRPLEAIGRAVPSVGTARQNLAYGRVAQTLAKPVKPPKPVAEAVPLSRGARLKGGLKALGTLGLMAGGTYLAKRLGGGDETTPPQAPPNPNSEEHQIFQRLYADAKSAGGFNESQINQWIQLNPRTKDYYSKKFRGKRSLDIALEQFRASNMFKSGAR